MMMNNRGTKEEEKLIEKKYCCW